MFLLYFHETRGWIWLKLNFINVEEGNVFRDAFSKFCEDISFVAWIILETYINLKGEKYNDRDGKDELFLFHDDNNQIKCDLRHASKFNKLPRWFANFTSVIYIYTWRFDTREDKICRLKIRFGIIKISEKKTILRDKEVFDNYNLPRCSPLLTWTYNNHEQGYTLHVVIIIRVTDCPNIVHEEKKKEKLT